MEYAVIENGEWRMENAVRLPVEEREPVQQNSLDSCLRRNDEEDFNAKSAMMQREELDLFTTDITEKTEIGDMGNMERAGTKPAPPAQLGKINSGHGEPCVDKKNSMDSCLRRNDESVSGGAVIRNSEFVIPEPARLSVEKKTDLLRYKDMMSVFAKVENVPLDLEKLPEFLKEYIALADKVTDASQGAKLTAFLTVIAANIANRVYMNNIGGRVFCNLWSIIIGPSSVSRKTTVLSLARSTMQPFEDSLDKLNIKEYERETVWLSNVTSAKLLSLLSINPNRLFFHNEISGFLAEISKNYNQGMKQKITEIFDGVSISNLNMERCERIKNPALSILAASTESWFYPQLGSKTEQLSGFMQRFLYCIISDIDVKSLNFDWVDTTAYREQFHQYEETYKLFRNLPLSFRLKAEEKALEYRNSVFKERMIEIYELHNDPIMSYFTRIYDGYWYKLCIIITLFKTRETLKAAHQSDSLAEFFEAVRVTQETAIEAMALCDYFFNNTLPLMKMMSEQDKLSGERKLVDILANKFEGRAFHTELMQFAHFDKKEMNAKIDTLLEMEVISVESEYRKKNKSSKVYVLDPEILAKIKK